MAKELFNDEIIHDEDARNRVFYKAYALIGIHKEHIEEAEQRGYVYREGKRLEGKHFKKELEKMKIEYEFLEKIFNSEEVEKYRIK